MANKEFGEGSKVTTGTKMKRQRQISLVSFVREADSEASVENEDIISDCDNSDSEMNHNPYYSDDSDAASADDCHTSSDDPSKDNSSEQGRLTITLSLLIFVCLFYHRL